MSEKNIAIAEQKLYDPQRLEYRFELFERFCLPALLSQVDKNFIPLIVVGENLPVKYLDRLVSLLEPLENSVIATVSPNQHYSAISEALNILPKGKFTHRTTFRLDDDDMLRPDYVKRLRRHCYHMGPFNPTQAFAVAFNRGYFLDLKDMDNPVLYQRQQDRPLGLGLSLTVGINDPRNIFAWNHLHVASHVTCLSNARVPMFIRTVHDHNDECRTINATYNKALCAEECETAMRENFDVSWSDISAPLLNRGKGG